MRLGQALHRAAHGELMAGRPEGLDRATHPGCGGRACGEPLIAHQQQQRSAWCRTSFFLWGRFAGGWYAQAT